MLEIEELVNTILECKHFTNEEKRTHILNLMGEMERFKEKAKSIINRLYL